jgi:hypothetical protein
MAPKTASRPSPNRDIAFPPLRTSQNYASRVWSSLALSRGENARKRQSRLHRASDLRYASANDLS